MQRSSILIFIIVFINVNTNIGYSSEQWFRTYGGIGCDQVLTIQETLDRGYIVTGRTFSGSVDDFMPALLRFSFGETYSWILKLESSGRVVWQKKFYLNDLNDSLLTKQTSDGGYIVTVMSTYFGSGNKDIWLLKLSQDGAEEWFRIYGGSGCDQIHSIQETIDGGYVVAGWTNKVFGANNYDIWLLKIDQDGDIKWQNTYGGGFSEQAHTIQETSDGGYIVAGWTYSLGNDGRNVWILKLRQDGDVDWQYTYGGGLKHWQDILVRETKEGGYIVETYTLSEGHHDINRLELSGNGDVKMKKTYYGTYKWSLAQVHSFQQTTDGGYILAGQANPLVAGNWDVWLLKLQQNGDIDWQKTYGSNDPDGAVSIQQTADGGYVVTGYTDKSIEEGCKDMWVLRVDENGEIPAGSITATDNTIVYDFGLVTVSAIHLNGISKMLTLSIDKNGNISIYVTSPFAHCYNFTSENLKTIRGAFERALQWVEKKHQVDGELVQMIGEIKNGPHILSIDYCRDASGKSSIRIYLVDSSNTLTGTNPLLVQPTQVKKIVDNLQPQNIKNAILHIKKKSNK
jgi:hypothetical protein